MTIKHHPATPLPWHLDDRSVCGWLPATEVLKEVETTVADLYGNDPDAEYLVHAANAYPRSIALMKRYAQEHTDIADLLRQLGEE